MQSAGPAQEGTISLSRLGARYPSAGGMIDWIVRLDRASGSSACIVRGNGSGLFTGGTVMLGYFSVLVVTAMVAFSFGNCSTLFDVSAIASIGSAVALVIYVLMTLPHLCMVGETQASRAVLYLALVTTWVAILLFAWYTLQTAPRTFAVLLVTVMLAWVVEAAWRRFRRRQIQSEAT